MKPGTQPPTRRQWAGIKLWGALVAGAILVVGLLVVPPKLRTARDDARGPAEFSPATPPGRAGSDGAGRPAANPEAPVSTANVETESARHYLNVGSDLLRQDKLKEAADQFRLALARNPADEDVHYNLGITLARLGETNEAIREYEETLRLMPDYAEAHNNLGNLLTKLGRYDEAIKHFNEAIRVMPENASAHNNLGTALGRQGKLPEAITQFATAARLQTNYVEAHFNLGNACLIAGQIDRAVAEFNEVLLLRPGFAPAQQALEKIAPRQQPGPVRP